MIVQRPLLIPESSCHAHNTRRVMQTLAGGMAAWALLVFCYAIYYKDATVVSDTDISGLGNSYHKVIPSKCS